MDITNIWYGFYGTLGRLDLIEDVIIPPENIAMFTAIHAPHCMTWHGDIPGDDEERDVAQLAALKEMQDAEVKVKLFCLMMSLLEDDYPAQR